MALTAAAGIFGFGPQAGKGTPADTFYRHRAIDVDLGMNDDVRLGQLEVGGTPVPTFPYKAGYIVGGGATLQPRLENTFGWFLYSALGKHTPTTLLDGPSGSPTGAYSHRFEMDSDASFVRWLSLRKVIPMKDGDTDTDLGETYTDCKVVGLSFQLPTDGPLTTRVDTLGCTFETDEDPTAFDWANSYEDWQSIPVACMTGGYIHIGSETLAITNANFAWQNQPLDIRQEKVYGSPSLEDVTIITRQLSFDINVKWNNPTLYQKVYGGAEGATEWSGEPFVASFEAKMVSGKNMPSLSEPYSLVAHADNAMMTQVGGVRLAAGQAVMLRFQGTIIEGAGTYAYFDLINKVADYTWPT